MFAKLLAEISLIYLPGNGIFLSGSLIREIETYIDRKKFKDDKDALKAEIQKLNPIYNRRLKDILGKERMIKYHDYFKAKYNGYLKSKN